VSGACPTRGQRGLTSAEVRVGGPGQKMPIFALSRNRNLIAPVNSLVDERLVSEVSSRSVDPIPFIGGVEVICCGHAIFSRPRFLNVGISRNVRDQDKQNSVNSTKLMWMIVVRSDALPMPRRTRKFTR
jgi:hypothetical protein